MKLKLIITSMLSLGTLSCPLHATTLALHKDKDLPICSISDATIIMNSMNQNENRAVPNPCNPGWFQRIRMAGGMNIDIGSFGNRNQNYMGENYRRVALNDAYLNLSADINHYLKAFTSLSYMTTSTNPNPAKFNNRGAAEYAATYANNINGSGNPILQIEQAYATIGDLEAFPFYIQFGKSFQDFDRYHIHPITRSMDQVMSELLTSSIKLGFLANGFHGSVFAFDTAVGEASSNANKGTADFGVSFGYTSVSDTSGWKLGAGYLYNLIGVNDIAYAIQNFNNATGYHRRVAAGNLFFGLNYDSFTLDAGYTIALNNFNRLDLPSNGYASLTNANTSVGSGTISSSGVAPLFVPGADGAKPWAVGVNAGYGFNALDKDQHIKLGYQASDGAAGLNLPRYRVVIGYDIDVIKHNNWAIEWDHDIGYKTAQGGTGVTANLVTIRSSFTFA